MTDLRIWMLGFGIFIGLIFPFFVIILGVAAETAMRPIFFIATVTAGLCVAEVNHFLVRVVVGARLRSLASGMMNVESRLEEATASGDWEGCNPETCMVVVDSTDEFGDVARSFNSLVTGLSSSQQVADGIKKVAQATAAHLEMGALADTAIRELTTRTGSEAAALLTVLNGEVELAGSMGLLETIDLSGESHIRRVLRTEISLVLSGQEELALIGDITRFSPREVHILPIQFDQALVACLVLMFAQPCTSGAKAIISASLPGIGVAVNNALTHESMQRMANLDPLTGVPNRHSGLVTLSEKFARYKESAQSLGVLILDLDHFKTVNDTFGHLVGDRVLSNAAHAVRSVLRQDDVIFRFGGEEFIVVLPGATVEVLATMGERIRSAVADTEVIEGGQSIRITVSLGGYACPPGDVETAQEMIGHADLALYASKQSGRDRCVIA